MSTWVQAVDGRFYKNPIIRGGKDWAITIFDDGPKVIFCNPDENVSSLLTSLGLEFEIDEARGRERGMWQVENGSKYVLAYHQYFELFSPIPVPQECDKVVDYVYQCGFSTVYLWTSTSSVACS